MLRHYEPWNLINQMNELLGSYKNSDSSTLSTSSWTPAIDIREEKDQYVIEADLPGVKKEDIEISMERGILIIKGERKEEHSSKENEYRRTERIYGSFHRQFTLPDIADSENIKANFNNGVLQLRLPKKELAKPKKIAISTNENSNMIEHK